MKIYNKYIDVEEVLYNIFKGLSILGIVIVLIFTVVSLIKGFIYSSKTTLIIIGCIFFGLIICYLVGYLAEKIGIR